MSPNAPETAAQRLADIRNRMDRAANRIAGSVPAELVAVSKTFDADTIIPVIEAGQRHFGENRVQEAQGKWPDLKTAYPDIVLHLIGPLQTNKAGDAVALFDVIESVDREGRNRRSMSSRVWIATSWPEFWQARWKSRTASCRVLCRSISAARNKRPGWRYRKLSNSWAGAGINMGSISLD
jgi:hypothetical protein